MQPFTRNTIVLLSSALMLGAGAGCAGHDVRRQADRLSGEIAVYRQEQASRIERLNDEYRAAFAENLDELVRLSDTELRQGRDVDAQALADQITESDRATHFGALRGRLAAVLVTHRASIATADKNIATARDNYLKSYKEAKLQLAKLDQLQADLAGLAEKEDALRAAGNLVQKIAENYRQIREEAKKQPQADNGGNEGT
jgi:hypothetical protein